jgi:methyl-accepting chemotaxis protein
VGTVINQIGVGGQLEGATIMGLGFATTEDLEIVDGHVQTMGHHEYKLPSIIDIPPLDNLLITTGVGEGPYGAKSVGDGKSGYVHLGIWRDAIGADARAAVRPIAASIVALVIGISGLFAFLATRMHRPFLELVGQAERISKGDFDVPLGVKREDEVGEIARSLERMRSSLHAVVRRLEQTNEPERSGKET